VKFAIIDTVYGRYAKGKWKRYIGAGLNARDFYLAVAALTAAYDRVRKTAPHGHVEVQVEDQDVDRYDSTNFHSYNASEFHWLLTGRIEYLITRAFFRHTAMMAMDFPLKHLVPADVEGRWGQTVRITRQVFGKAGSASAAGAYVTISKDPEEYPGVLVLSVRLVDAKEDLETLRWPVPIRRGTTCRLDWNKSFDDLLDQFIEGTEDRAYNSEANAANAACYARMAMAIIALDRMKHRAIERQPARVLERVGAGRIATSPYLPVSFVVGRGFKDRSDEFDEFAQNFPKSDGQFLGRLYWESFSETDGQFLIDWPTWSETNEATERRGS